MSRRLFGVSCLAILMSSVVLSARVEAHDRFSFGLSIGGGPIYAGPPCCYDPFLPPPPPPIVYRRVYVTPRVETVVVPPLPTATRRVKSHDPLLLKIGELHSDDADVREDAAEWLGSSRDPRAVRPLIEALQHDRKDDVREAAARSLGRIGGIEAEQALIAAAAADTDDDVRRTASKSLTRMAKGTSHRIVR